MSRRFASGLPHFRRVALLWAGLAVVLIVTGASGCSNGQDTTSPVAKTSPAGAISPSAEQFSSPAGLAEKADIPLYPGADTPEGKSTVRANGEGTRYEIVMSTTDPSAKVLKFYEGKLQHAEMIAGGTTVMGNTPKGNYVSVKTSRANDRTDINVVVTQENASATSGSAGAGEAPQKP